MSYDKRNVILTPRNVTKLPSPPPPIDLPTPYARDTHWVGWVNVTSWEKDECRWFAVWQDYKKRGFFVLEEGAESPITVFGQDYDDVLAAIERVCQAVCLTCNNRGTVTDAYTQRLEPCPHCSSGEEDGL